MPLDYFNETYPNTSVSVAIATLPAPVPVDDHRYAGPILINPGGPGGSGVALALGAAKNFQDIVNPSPTSDGALQTEGKYYDILGFDPRGIGWTEPAARCMPDSPSAWSWRLRQGTEGMLGSSDAALGRLWAMTHAYGTSCKLGMDGEEGPDIKQYMSTASVARDMIEIAEKHAEWAAEKTTELAAKKSLKRSGCGRTAASQYQRGQVKLQYWGFSYGTYLGATFSSMFPDRVSRVILDGVVNAHDYNNALGQGSLADTEKDMSSFYTSCLYSGPEACPLATPTSTVHDIEERVQKIIKSLYHSPIAINSPYGPELFTYTDLNSIIFSSLYTPAFVFPTVAHILAAVEAGGGAFLENIAIALRGAHVYSCPVNGSAPYGPSLSEVPTFAILCGDGVDQTSLDIPGFEQYWELLQGISPAAGSLWAMLKMSCAAWPIKPLFSWGQDERFQGNTSHPILWISNTADPVTPLKSGRAMADKFPGSVVLVQDSAGHCSLSTPTACTVKAVKEYFQSGALPDPEIVCIPPTSPFSLNSTDPKSPFYDPSLGKAVFLAEENMEDEMIAAKNLQWWTVGNEFLGRGHLGQRVADVVTNAAMSTWERIGNVDEL